MYKLCYKQSELAEQTGLSYAKISELEQRQAHQHPLPFMTFGTNDHYYDSEVFHGWAAEETALQMEQRRKA